MKRRVFGIAALLGVIAGIAAWTAAAGSQSATLQAPVTLPFTLVTRHMVLPVAVNNSRPLAFVLDLGSGVALALHSPFVAEHRLPGPDVKTIASLGRGGTGGATTGRTGRVAALTIGQFTIRHVPAHFSEDASGAFASAAVNGNIGQQVMGRFRIFHPDAARDVLTGDRRCRGAVVDGPEQERLYS